MVNTKVPIYIGDVSLLERCQFFIGCQCIYILTSFPGSPPTHNDSTYDLGRVKGH